MHPCNGCGVLTTNAKYCSKKCSTTINNKLIPKRKPEGSCKICGKAIRSVLSYCSLECKQIKKEKSKKKRLASACRRIVQWRRRLKQKAIQYLGGKCIHCGYSKCARALQFHHRDRKEKEFVISRPSTAAWDIVKLELDKCDLLCSNCHAEEEDRIYWGVAQPGTADGRYPSSA